MKRLKSFIMILSIAGFATCSTAHADIWRGKTHIILEKTGVKRQLLESQTKKTDITTPNKLTAPVVTIIAGPKTSLTTNESFTVVLNVDKNYGFWSTNGSSYHQFAKGDMNIPIVHDTVLRFYGFDGTLVSSTNINSYKIISSLKGTLLWNMNTALETSQFSDDGCGSAIVFDTSEIINTNNNGTGSVRLSPATIGNETKIKFNLTSKLGLWKGSEISILIKIPLDSNISNIYLSMFTAPQFKWIDMSTVNGPFTEGCWTRIVVPLNGNMVNAIEWATNGQQVMMDLVFIKKSNGSDKKINNAVNINGISIVNTKSSYFGAWSHFMDSAGNGTEGDIVETATVVEGLLSAIQYFSNNNSDENLIRSTASSLWRNIDWDAYRNGGNTMRWSYKKIGGSDIFGMHLTGFNECMSTYLLGLASPTHPISIEFYNTGWAPSGYGSTLSYYGYKQYLQLFMSGNDDIPLYETQYSYMGFDPRTMNDGKIDDAENYYKVFQNISMINYAYCTNAPAGFGYKPDLWGLTACDGPSPKYYWARSPAKDDGTIAPTAALSAMPYVPAQSYAALTNYYKNPALANLRGTYGFKDAFNPQENWYDNDYIAIDQGPIVVMIENYRTQLLWKLFMSHPDIKALMTKLGNNGWTIYPQTYNGTPLDSTPMNSAYLNAVQSNTLQYFLQGSAGCHASGMARDRLNDNIASGGTGMGMMAIIVGIERKFITRSAGIEQIKKILKFLKDAQ